MMLGIEVRTAKRTLMNTPTLLVQYVLLMVALEDHILEVVVLDVLDPVCIYLVYTLIHSF